MFGGTYSQIESFRLILASRRKAYRNRIEGLLSGRSGFILARNALLDGELLGALGGEEAEVILIDPTGFEEELGEWLYLLREKAPGITPIIISGERMIAALCRDYFSAGVMGILSPDFSPELLRKAVKTVLQGEHWITRKMAGKVFSELLGFGKAPKMAPVEAYPLTHREQEILGLVSRGFRNREIGKALSISEKTVKTHLTHIFGKLKIQNRLQAALYANRVLPAGSTDQLTKAAV